MAGDFFTDYDPWIGDPVQSHRRKARCDIFVDGRDVTNKFDPYLISVRVMDGQATPQAEIELDDRDARLDIPGPNARLWVNLGWAGEALTRVFSGRVSQVECGFGRKQGGRRMWIYGAGGQFFNTKLTSAMDDHSGEGAMPGKEVGEQKSFQDAMSQFAKNAGHSVSIHPALSGLMRDHWSQSGESFYHLGERFARQFGATFRVLDGNKAEISLPGFRADGSQGGVVEGVWGKNLIAYRVHPWIARSTWGSASMQYFSTLQAGWKKVTSQFNLPMPFGSNTNFAPPMPAAHSGASGQQGEGVGNDMWAGGGRIVINGEPAAQFPGFISVVGARPGVDGLWMFKVVEHRYSRQGYVTWIDVDPYSKSGGVAGGRPISAAFEKGGGAGWDETTFDERFRGDTPDTFDQRFPGATFDERFPK